MIRLPFYSSAPALGLAWREDRLHISPLTRTKTGADTGPVVSVPWARADLTPSDPAPVGATLRTSLLQAGITGRACVVALPSDWILSATATLPDLTAEDFAAFVELTAERSFPYSPDELQIVRSIVQLPASRQLTLLAVRRTALERFRQVLITAGLKPLGLTFGLPLLPEFNATDGSRQLSLELESNRSVLLATANHQIVGLRDLEAITDSASALVRGLRLSWEQFPPEFRASLRVVKVVGSSAQLHQVEPPVTRWAAGIKVDLALNETTDLGDQLAVAVAQDAIAKNPRSLQFLPPAPTAWQRLMARLPRQRMGSLAAIGGAAVGLLLLALVWQSFTRWRLREQWIEIKPAVTVTESLQANIRQFRSWSDTTPDNLSILLLVSNIFPRTGVVTAKNVAINDSAVVTITGTTTDNSALLQALDALRRTPSVSEVKLDQIRGRSPAQFTFKFTWKGQGV